MNAQTCQYLPIVENVILFKISGFLLNLQANFPVNSSFLSALIAALSRFHQIFIVLGMYNFGHRTKKCIHPDARCDLHPHPACTYLNEKGETEAEDEENCNEDYVNKGLVSRTVNMKCISPIHNTDSLAIRNYPYNLTEEENKNDWISMKKYNWLLHLQVIPQGRHHHQGNKASCHG